MEFSGDQLFQYLYFAEIFGFSLYLITLTKLNASIWLWLVSNAMGLAGSLFVSAAFLTGSEVMSAQGAALTVAAGGIKALSFSRFPWNRKSNFWPNVLNVLGLAAALYIAIDTESPYRLLMISFGGTAVTLSAIMYLSANKYWAGLKPVFFATFVLSVSIFTLLYVGSVAYPLGEQTKFIMEKNQDVYQFFGLCLLTFFFHMAFIALIRARQQREQLFESRRSMRLLLSREIARESARLNRELAEESYHLVQMLTHEVRQPLNTAQAALQTVQQQLSAVHDRAASRSRVVLDEAQVTLGAIILSISNSILGASLIAGGRKAVFVTIDVCAICELALLDLDPSQRARIERRYEQDVLYIEADPVVLRLAIRNLLENAVRYSEPNTNVLFDLLTDEALLAVIIRVTNDLSPKHIPVRDSFDRYRRGSDSRYEGSGLGLYIVKEVASMHSGRLIYRIENEKKVVFELTIRA